MDSNSIYTEFIDVINKNMVKVEEMTAKVTKLHNEVSNMMIEITTLFEPSVLVRLEELEDASGQFEKNIAEGQEIKNSVAKLLDPLQPRKTADDYQQIMASLGLKIDQP